MGGSWVKKGGPPKKVARITRARDAQNEAVSCLIATTRAEGVVAVYVSCVPW